MKRPNRPPTASTPIVVQIQSAPAPKKEGKLPEWASLTAFVTGVTIVAFALSSFYVAGVERSLDKPLAVYFSPTDYLRITPSWAILTLGLATVIFVVVIAVAWFSVALPLHVGTAVRALYSERALYPEIGAFFEKKLRLIQKKMAPIPRRLQSTMRRLKILLKEFKFVLLFVAALLILMFSFDFLMKLKLLPEHRDILEIVRSSLETLAVLMAGVALIPVSKGVKLLLLLLVTVACSLGFALSLGRHYAVFDLQKAPLSRVLFESEKDPGADVEGGIIFDLDRYLLLFTKAKSVVAIPHDRIKRIETPSQVVH